MAQSSLWHIRHVMSLGCALACALPHAALAGPAVADDTGRLEALLRSGKLDDAIAQSEAALPTAQDAKVGAVLAEACQKKATAMAEKGKPPADLLAMVDRGLRGLRSVKLLKFRGRILTALQRPAEAYEAYEEALDRGPDGKDQVDIASEMTNVYKPLGQRMCRASVTASHPDAELRVGVAGEPRKLPARLWLPHGHHAVTVGPAGGPFQSRQIECAATPVALHVEVPKLAAEWRAQDTTPAPAPAEPVSLLGTFPPPTRSALHRYGPWSTVAVGVIGLGLGGWLQHDYNQQANAGQVPPSYERPASLAGYVGGGTLVVGGLAWWWLTREVP